jgi:hypothetical protein
VLYLKHAGDRNRLEEAVALLRRASSMGHIQSTRRLGWILAKGHFGVLNILRGLRMFVGAGVTAAKLAVKEPSSERLRDLPIDPMR